MRILNAAARQLQKLAAEVLKGGPGIRLRREEIPRLVRVMENLTRTDLIAERSRILFHDKFAQPGEPIQREYLATDPENPVSDPAILTPPKHLYARGLPAFYRDLQSEPFVDGGHLNLAIVGPISPRVNAAIFAEKLAETAINEVNARVISGFAEGIDKHAHLGALDAFGRTTAFLPHGIMNKQFYTDTTLFKYLIPLFQGGFISEYYITRLDPAGNLHMRGKHSRRESTANANKMLLLRDGRTTALADAVVVIEAAQASGSVDTGRRAYLQGIPVFVVDWRMVELNFTRGLPDVINGGLKQLANEGCAKTFPLRGSQHKVPLDQLPELFLNFILSELENQKNS